MAWLKHMQVDHKRNMCDTKDLILKKIVNKMKIHYKMLYLRMKNWIGT